MTAHRWREAARVLGGACIIAALVAGVYLAATAFLSDDAAIILATLVVGVALYTASMEVDG